MKVNDWVKTHEQHRIVHTTPGDKIERFFWRFGEEKCGEFIDLNIGEFLEEANESINKQARRRKIT